MKKILFSGIAVLLSTLIGNAQTVLDETGTAFLRNSTSTTEWTGTTQLVLGATAAQTTGFTLSYEADSNPRVGRLTLNNNYGGVYGDFAISLRSGSGIFEKFRLKNEWVEFFSRTTQNSLYVGRDINQNLKMHVTDNHGYLDYNQDEDGNGPHIFFIRNLSGGTSNTNDIRLQTTGQDRLTIDSRGYVGLGINEPVELLDIEGDVEVGLGSNAMKIKQGNLTFEGVEKPYLFHDLGTNRKIGLGITDDQGVRNYIELYEGNVPNTQYIDFGIEGSSAMKINAEGKVAIGTNDFSNDHKLRVEGSIGTREVVVESDGWSDFVFEDDYELPTLEKVEAYIDENGHLSEIPSEAEVLANGVSLGEMDAKLLQKIEELTLYLIQQNKELKSAHQKIEELHKQVLELQNQ